MENNVAKSSGKGQAHNLRQSSQVISLLVQVFYLFSLLRGLLLVRWECSVDSYLSGCLLVVKCWSYRAASPRLILIAFPMLPVVLLNSSDPLGVRIRPLAQVLLFWERRAAVVKGPLPTTAACVSKIPVCGLKMQNKDSFCAAGPEDVCAVSGNTAGCPVFSLVGTTVQQTGGQC